MEKAESERLLEKVPFANRLTSEEKSRVTESLEIMEFPAGGEVTRFGGGCLGMVFVLSGVLRAYLLSEEGREITLFRMKEGDSCVMTASCAISQITFETNMTAEADCRLLVIPTGVFSHLTDTNIYVRCFMYELLTERFSSVMWTIQQILFHGIDRRLASALLENADKSGKNEIKMTHEEIAREINSAREVVARMLKRFVSDGIVELKRGSVIIKNRQELEKLSGGLR